METPRDESPEQPVSVPASQDEAQAEQTAPSPANPAGSPAPEGKTEVTPRAEIPPVVRAYGSIIVALNAIGMALACLAALVWLAQGGVGGAVGGVTSIFAFVIAFVMLRLGSGLKKGERNAVHGLCVLAGIGVLVGLIAMSGSPGTGVMLLGLVGLVYLPPIVSAFGRWDAFR